MQDQHKTKSELINELTTLRQHIASLEGQNSSARQPAKKQLNDSETHYQMLIEALPYGIQEHDTAGVITFTNPAYDRLVGCAPGERIGTAIWDFVPSEAEEEQLRQHLAVLVTQQPVSTTYYVRQQSTKGRVIDLQVDWNYKRNEAGELLGFISVITEITNHKQSEEQLRHTMELVERSKSLLTAVIDATPDWIFAKDRNFRFILVNKSFAKAMGMIPQQMIGKNEAELGLPADQIFGQPDNPGHDFRVDDEAVLQGETWHNPNDRVTGLDGTNLIFDTYKLPLRDHQGSVVAILRVSRDVTKQRLAEETLQKQTEFQKAILNNAGYSIISTDGNGVIQTFNSTAEQMLGYRAEDIINCASLTMFHDPEELKIRAKLFSEEVGQPLQPDFEVLVVKSRHNLLNEHEWQYIRQDGQRLSVLLTITAMRDPKDHIFGFLAIANDITERKEMETELEAYRYHLEKLIIDRTYRLELIAELSGQLIAILDLNELLAELVNQLRDSFQFYHVHVYLVDKETGDLVMFEGSGDVGHLLKAKGHRLRAGQGIVGSVAQSNQPFMSEDVDKVPQFFRNPLLPNTVAELAVPIRKADVVLGVLDIQSDQPGQLSLEDVSLIQSIADQTAIAIDNARLLAEREATIVKLQEVDQAKSRFITMMSHELRTPLNAILGFTELLMMGLSGDLSPQVQQDVELIFSNGQHLLGLINDILDISQIETGQTQLSLTRLHLREVLAEVLAETSSLVKDNSLDFVTEVPASLPPVYADPTRLKQILFNLISNAIKFTPAGVVMIKAEVSPSEPSKAVITVKDTGIGIPADKQQAIFELFNQVDMSDARQYGGTGLGLAICKELVQIHGGEIGVRSEHQVGSEFFFTISLAE